MDNDDIKRQERRQQQRHQRFLQHQQWPPSPTAPPEQPAPGDYHKLVYFTCGQRHEAAKFTCDTPAHQLKELFRSAAEAGPHDILKLYDSEGHLMNISGELASNTADERYTLEVVSAHTGGMLADEFGVDLAALESRVAQLESQLRAECDVLPPALQELRQQVDGFKHKLETTEHLSWLGFYKNLPEPISSEECKRLQYRRKSDSIRKRVKERFFQICDGEVSERVRLWIRMPTFDSRQWEDEEVLLILQQMFLDLDLCAKLGIDLNIFRNFLFEVYKNYNEVPFHNFRHCFCVAQMMYAIIWAADLPSKLGDLEILILLVSCICHDLDHPGFNNIYQINAKTELALRYNDISPLENHHCSVAFRILEMDDCNIFKGFSMETFKQVREGMIRCILATDMARHNEILAQFKEITPDFDYSNKAHTNLLTMVLIKVADISNEARPMDVAEPWLDRLLQEFFKQSDAEKLEGLPVTPFMDREKITKPSSQCSFIGFVLLPLFEALGDLLTELQDLIIQPVRDALDYYRRLNEATKEERLHRKSVVGELLNHPVWAYSHPTCPRSPDDSSSTSTGTNVTISVSKSGSAQSVKSRKSISFQQNRSRSRSIEEDMQPTVENLEESAEENSSLNDLLEDNESGDSETATEVEVSEKTLKFKISTEGSIGNSGRKSYPGSRKGSREKGQQSACSELAAKAVQWEKDKGKLSSLTVSFERPSTKKFSLDMTSESLEGFRKFHGRSLDISKFGGFGSPTSGKSIDFAEDDENKDSEEEKSYKNVNELSVQEPGTVCDRKSILKSPNTGVGADETEKCTVDNLVNNKYDSSKHINVVSFEDVTRPDKTEPKTDALSQSQKSDDNNRTFVIDNSVKCNNTKSDEILVEKYDLKNVPVSESVLQEKSVEPKISPNNNHRSFLSRIKQFTDRFGLSFDKETTKLKNSKVSGGSFKNNNGSKVTVLPKTKCKKIDSHCCRSVEDEYTDIKKASTLPKMKKTNHPESKKGWKYLITGSGSSLDVLPPNLPPKDIESDNQLSPSSSRTKSSLLLYPKAQNNADTKIDCHLFDQSGAGPVKVDDTSPPKEVDKPIDI